MKGQQKFDPLPSDDPDDGDSDQIMTDGPTFAVKAQQCMMNSLPWQSANLANHCNQSQSVNIWGNISQKSTSISQYLEKYICTHIQLYQQRTIQD